MLADSSNRLPQVRLVQTYQMAKSMSLLREKSDRLLWVLVVQRSLGVDTSDWILLVLQVHMARQYKSTSLLPHSSDSLPNVVLLQQVPMYLFNLVIILHTGNWYVIQVHRIITVPRRKCYQIHCLRPHSDPKPTCCPRCFPGTHPSAPKALTFYIISLFHVFTY